MTQEPLISIVMPVFNREGIVERTLQSIKAQTHRPLHVILVDNNSTDRTRDVLEQWANEAREPSLAIDVLSCTTPGAAAARNTGIEKVATPWVMHFDSDDTMAPNHVERVVQAITTHPDADVVGWSVRFNRLKGRRKILSFRVHNLLYDCVLHGTFSSLRYACRTDLLRDCGLWDTKLSTWDDIELGTRMIMQYPDISVTRLKGKPSVDVFQSKESISGESFHNRAEQRELALNTISRALRPYEQYIVNLKRIILAAHYRREGYHEDAHKLRQEAIASTERLWHRVLMRIAYSYTAMGGRGIARILYPLW